MNPTAPVTLYHAPQSRSTGILVLLEELNAPYELQLINMKAGKQREPEYLAVNPMGKVPAIRYRGELVTEQAAIYIYLADAFPDAGLAPALDDAQRGPYLRWIVYYAACFEPGMTDHAMKREPLPIRTSPYGDYDVMVQNVLGHIESHEYICGAKFTAADVLWGSALSWMIGFKMVTPSPAVADYVKRVTSRPAWAIVKSRDVAWAQEHAEDAAK